MDWQVKLKELGIHIKHKSGSAKLKCPACIHTKRDKSATDLSVSIYSDRVLYQCHNGCGFKGVVFMNPYTKKAPEKVYKRPEPAKSKDDKTRLYEYWQKRGISKETVDKYEVKLGDRKIQIEDKWQTVEQMIFPYYKDAELVNHKYRWIDPTSKKKKFKQDFDYKDNTNKFEQVFYGMDLITDFSRLIICEGEPDVLTFAQLGLEAVSVPQGAHELKMDCIENCWEWLQQFDEYIICVDNDEAGRKLENTLIGRLGREKCKVAKYELEGTEGLISFKDANEALVNCEWGDDFLKMVIENAEPLPVENIIRLSDCKESTLHYFEHGWNEGLPTGWACLNRILKIHPGYVFVLTGRPSSGKSIFWKNLTLNLTKSHDWKHLMFDKESAVEKTNIRMASIYCKKYIPNDYYQHNPDLCLTKNDVLRSIEILDNNFIFLSRVHEWTIDDILKKGLECKRRYGINTLTIDPFNLVKNDATAKDMRLYVREFLSKCIDFALSNDVLVCVVAHPTKPCQGKTQVGLYDISESSDWVNMSHYGCIVHRQRNEDETWSNESKIIMEKVKEEDMGYMGSCKLTMGRGCFVDLDTKYEQQKFKM